ncbi:MAG: lysyl-tRNA synthetase, class, partial [Acidimicrobiaceae bacterium]
ASVDRPSIGRALSLLATGGAVAIGTGTVTALWLPRHSGMPVGQALLAVTERLAGIDSIVIPGRRDQLLVPTLGAVGLSLALIAVWMVCRPVVRRVRGAGNDWARARELVASYGKDTLSYFALRDDKGHWLWHNTLVTYAVINGVCLVSPDPVGPDHEREDAWQAFRAHADGHGWSVAVMAASETWLPIYRSTGMKDLYIGDEAIVDVQSFSLDGGKKKGLRQAVNRIAKYGYTLEFHDPAHLAPDLEAALRALMTESRRGEVERGFSMTLGRVFSKEDEGLLLAVCFGPDGAPAAFCQYVPAPGIDGWSLDLMRRSEHGEHWNGVTDFVVCRTIEHLREQGQHGLGLNFAVMRSVLAEDEPGLGQRLERKLLGWLSESMQIESRWRYNAKFDPTGLPRYASYDSFESFVPALLAVAKAESFWELPIIGRFLIPAHDERAPEVPKEPAAV